MVFFVLLLVSIAHASTWFGVQKWEPKHVIDVAELYKQSGVAMAPACMAQAVSLIPAHCEMMDEDDKARLSLSIANCHFERTGKRTYPCRADQKIAQCTSSMDDIAYPAYTTFLAQTAWVCQNLQREARDRAAADVLGSVVHVLHDTAGTVSRIGEDVIENANVLHEMKLIAEEGFSEMVQMSKIARSMSNAIDTVSAKQDKLGNNVEGISAQTEVLRSRQEEIANEQAKRLENVVDSLSSKASETLAKIQSIADDQDRISAGQERMRVVQRELQAGLDSVISIQSKVFGGIVGTVWYLEMIALSVFATSTRRTSRARLLLAAGLASIFAIERTGPFYPEEFVPMLRMAFMIYGAISIGYSYFAYHDIKMDTYNLVKRLLKQIEEKGTV